jgi:hypothetical protein
VTPGQRLKLTSGFRVAWIIHIYAYAANRLWDLFHPNDV